MTLELNQAAYKLIKKKLEVLDTKEPEDWSEGDSRWLLDAYKATRVNADPSQYLRDEVDEMDDEELTELINRGEEPSDD